MGGLTAYTYLINQFFRTLKAQNRIKLTDDNLVNLEKLGLLKKRIPTFASLLLFGNHNTGIHIGRFKDRDLIIDDILIKSPLIEAVDEALRFIQKNISVSFHFENQLKRIEKWQYPIPVLREILLNAIIHRDYQSPNDIIIKIFDNSIEFISPGKLMGDLSIDALMTDFYIAVHRNKLLCEAFYLLAEVEKYGTGFIRIRKRLLDYPGIKFKIENTGGFVKICLTDVLETDTQRTNNKGVVDNVPDNVVEGVVDSVVDNDPDNVLDNVPDNVPDNVLDKRLQLVLSLLMMNDKIRIQEIANQLMVSKRTVRRDIEKLKALNKINRIGNEKTGYWQVNSKSE